MRVHLLVWAPKAGHVQAETAGLDPRFQRETDHGVSGRAEAAEAPNAQTGRSCVRTLSQ